ncbi:QueT transporter family protein [Enterococcus mundtii]|uniref:QueT transporter family protein n=1 Tax=Enterococcus mundtii TaxID=53346 RepID=UPI000D3A3CD9|nr:QueT transporter family protein [Enterococcus mundtii]PTO41451.1 QueT transporter family protein [Enterococcus mundtii]
MERTKSRQRLMVVVANGLIMALYLALTILVAPVSSGPIQFRISESLNHLVVFNRKLLWGVLGGVIVYNAIYGFGVMDVIFGGGQTLLALGLTALIQNKVKNVKVRLALNTAFFTISMFMIAYMLVPTGGQAFWTTYGTLALSEFIVMAVSAPLMYYLDQAVKFNDRV